MRTYLTIALCLVAAACGAKTIEKNYSVKNLAKIAKPNEAVVIALPGAWIKSARVFEGKNEIPSQTDDLDRDGTAEEVAFVVDLRPGETKKLRIEFSDEAAPADRYPAKVFAQMFLRRGTKKAPVYVPVKEVFEGADTMYNVVYPHGPTFESELIAYRLYFDKKQTVDIYGKRTPGLELEEVIWYPTDAQLAKGSGDDIILVKNSVGVGTLKGWDPAKKQAVHVDPMTGRWTRILATGPVRTVVDMVVEGWELGGKTIGMRSRYILYAGHRDMEVQNTITGDYAGLTFATGVMNMADNTHMVDGKRVAAVWGTDFPVNDTVKFGKQTCGLAVSIPESYIVSQIDDADSYLYQLKPDARGRIDYLATCVAKKEEFESWKTDQDFFDHVKAWDRKVKLGIEIKEIAK